MVKPKFPQDVDEQSRRSRLLISKNDVNVVWKTGEKRRLLAGLHEHGCDDISKLQRAVRTKTVKQIEYFLMRRREISKRKGDESNEDSAIEVWIERATKALRQKPDYSKAVIEAMANGSKTATNYSEVYSFLLRLLKNEPTADLSVPSSMIMLRLLNDLATTLRKLPLPDIQSWFDTLDFSKPLSEQTVPMVLEHMDESTLSYSENLPLFKNTPSMNPLAILPEILQYVDMFLHD